VNRSQLQAMLWMRWRILLNRLRRASKLSNILLGVVLVLCFAIAVAGFIFAFLIGVEELHKAESIHILVIWLALAVSFFFFWMSGVMVELQRSDSMSFKNLLHLPVSLGWVFLYNYLGSYISVSMLIFLPAMLGLSLALVVVHGPIMLLGFLLIAGFFGMITALTYQLRGWLARLMEDKRRGRNIMMAVTFCFVLLVQIPNLINMSVNIGGKEAREERAEWKHLAEREGPRKAEAIAKVEELKRQDEILEVKVERYVKAASLVIPIGWLPYGMAATFDGRWFRGIMCTLGMFLIAALSLRRSYRLTLRSVVHGGEAILPLEIGDDAIAESSSASTPALANQAQAADSKPAKPPLVERRIPFVSDETSGVAFAALQNLLRAPEAKMMLLSPVILLGLFAFMLAKNSSLEDATAFAPGMSLAAVVMGMISIQQLLQNQFGLDRAGFRAYLLSPVPRRRILLGKNLALAPISFIISLTALILLEFFVVLDVQHFFGACIQLVSAFLILSMVGNQISIFGPIQLKEVGMQAANAKFKIVLLQILSILLVPLSLSPLLLPWWIEVLCRNFAWAQWVPIYILLHALALVLFFKLFRNVVRRQGDFLQSREQAILETLTRI
jgi:ABC-2 type transport system permease protein